MQRAREAQIEFRPVNKNHGVGLAFDGGITQCPKGAPEFRQHARYFNQSHN